MKKTSPPKSPTSFVQSVLKLDNHFTELDRLSALIHEIEIKSEFDVSQLRKLMGLFSEHGEAVGVEVAEMAKQLNESRMRAEASAQLVSEKAEELRAYQEKQNSSMEAFQELTAKVQSLNQQLVDLKKPEGEAFSEEEKVQVASRLSQIELQLGPLIEEALRLKEAAHEAKMKSLEQNADSLTQSLMAVRKKIELSTRATLTQ